jgi:SWI/SNF related-matrix-associated actin-dependent regulator of chromatin subfamily C
LHSKVADNPVLTLASFLGQLVPPEVAKAAAQAAIDKVKGIKPRSPTKASSPVKVSSPTKPGSPTKSPTRQPREDIQKAGATALGAAAAKASHLADLETSEMQSQVSKLISLQMQKMELKLQHFQEMEKILELERKELEMERQQVYLDRLDMKKLEEVKAVDVEGVDMEGVVMTLQ